MMDPLLAILGIGVAGLSFGTVFRPATGADVDVIDGSAADETLEGGPGDDLIFGNGGYDTILGGAGEDSIVVSGGGGSVYGGAGSDMIDARLAAETVALTGGPGSDTLWGGAGHDILIAEGAATPDFTADDSEGFGPDLAADTLNGFGGMDALFFGPGDVVSGGADDDYFGVLAVDLVRDMGSPARILDLDPEHERVELRRSLPGGVGDLRVVSAEVSWVVDAEDVLVSFQDQVVLILDDAAAGFDDDTLLLVRPLAPDLSG